MYSVTVVDTERGVWYYVFEDKKGLWRYLPTKERKSWLSWLKVGKPIWTPENCPASYLDNSGPVLCFTNTKWIERVSRSDVLRTFLTQYASLEAYLAAVNSGSEVSEITYEQVLWNTRNRYGRCGKCGNTLDLVKNPESEAGICQPCHTVSSH